MSCQKCKDFQDSDYTSFYRWKNANIEMRGCPEHLREIMEVLNNYQTSNKNLIINVPSINNKK